MPQFTIFWLLAAVPSLGPKGRHLEAARAAATTINTEVVTATTADTTVVMVIDCLPSMNSEN